MILNRIEVDMLPTKKIVLLIVLLMPVSIAFEAHASMVRNCIFKARIVDIQKDKEKIKKYHPDVTFGGVCYADVYFVHFCKRKFGTVVADHLTKVRLLLCIQFCQASIITKSISVNWNFWVG